MKSEMIQLEWLIDPRSIIGLLILFITYKLLKNILGYFLNHPYFKPCTMSTLNCNPLLFYFRVFKSIRENSRPGCPVICLFLQLLLGACEVFEKDRIVQLYLGMTPGIFFFKPETVEVVLRSSTLIDKSIHYKVLESWLGKGIFTSSGEEWRKRRKLLTPAFHFSILEDFIPVVQEQSNVFVSKLQTLVQEPWVDIVPLTVLCTLDIIFQTAMGIKINAQSNENQEYIHATHEVSNAVINRMIQPWLYSDFIYNMTSEGKKYKANLQREQGFVRKVIKEKKTEMLSRDVLKQKEANADSASHPGTRRKPFLELLLEFHLNEASFTEENVREEVDTFMFAGHDSTGMGISYVLYCIGLYPEVQKKIAEELQEVFHYDKNREITREDLTKLKYLECTIKETLRLYPLGPFFVRECTETFEVLGHNVYPGSSCLIFPYALHRDREQFPDPEKFIPERFFPENSKGRHPYAYIPFSAGPRNCIETILKAIIRGIFEKYRFIVPTAL